MKSAKVGKVVADATYIHGLALECVESAIADLVVKASEQAGVLAISANVYKIDPKRQIVSLLHYPNFFEHAFPALAESWCIYLNENRTSYRSYAQSLNPPILHRKELLLPSDHPMQPELRQLSRQAEDLGLFDKPSTIGFLNNWVRLLDEKGYRIEGHSLQPIGNDLAEVEVQAELSADKIQRHLTALSRNNFSAPVQLLARHGFIKPEHRFFDYGCGRGDDLASIKLNGIEASGWDPHYAPDQPIHAADVVNLGFVLNVIEDIEERAFALKRAFSLSQKVLAVSVMLYSSANTNGKPYRDGFLTSKNTFQKYFTQAEFKEFIELVLEEEAIPVAPGIMFVFADKDAEQQFLTARYRSSGMIRRLQRAELIRPERVPRISRKEQLYQENKPLLDALWEVALDLGRWPDKSEIPNQLELLERLKTLPRALRAIESYYDLSQFDQAAETRKNDLLVFFAMQYFGKRKPYKHLESRLQRDIKQFFGDYSQALEHGRDLLLRASDPAEIDAACAWASEQGLGWLEPSQSLQLHVSQVEQLPALLRVYVACGLMIYGDLEEADLIKIHIRSGKLTLMKFDDFSAALPRMVRRIKINLRKQEEDVFEYGEEFSPPYLYLKSRYLNEDFPGYAEQEGFDEQLQTLSLFDLEGYGPPADVFQEKLRLARREVADNQLIRARSIPSLDDPCGANYTYRDLIECGETWERTRIDNTPKEPGTFNALHDLATNILDPVIDYFGPIKLTYGFCSPQLAKLIPARIAPELDQHASYEKKRTGKFVCERLGAACDFLIEDEDMLDVAEWVRQNLPYDRLYFYGCDRPLHVSASLSPAKQAYEMVKNTRGFLTPNLIVGHQILYVNG